MRKEWIKIVKAFFFAFVIISIPWIIKTYEYSFDKQWYFLGIFPRDIKGLHGIITAVFVHGDFHHLWSNTVPFFILSAALFYFYDKKSILIYALLWLTTGMLVWFFAKASWHIGASGMVYALAAFHISSGIIKNVAQQRAFAMVVIFLWGGIIWGVFPDFFPERNISWESHLYGILSGILYAFYFRKSGPQRIRYDFEEEEEEEEEDNDDALETNKDIDDKEIEENKIKIIYHNKG